MIFISPHFKVQQQAKLVFAVQDGNCPCGVMIGRELKGGSRVLRVNYCVLGFFNNSFGSAGS